MKNTPLNKKPLNVKLGEFPFPLAKGPTESRYLTWLRNHSNYMLENGFTDYLRIIAVLVRGIFLNFLILLPYFLAFGAIMAFLHLSLSQPKTLKIDYTPSADATAEMINITVLSNFNERKTLSTKFDRSPENIQHSLISLIIPLWDSTELAHIDWTLIDDAIVARTDPTDDTEITITANDLLKDSIRREFDTRSHLAFSGWLLVFAGIIVVLYPIVMRMNRVRGYRNALSTGHYSSVKRRDAYERAFGTLLLVMILAAAVETFPLLTAYFHEMRQGDVAIAIPTIATMVGGIVAANQVLPVLGGLAKKIAIVAVGLLGLAIPLTVVLFTVEFLVYTPKYDPTESKWDEWLINGLLIPPALFAALLFITWIIGLRSFRKRGHIQLLGLIFAMLALFGAVYAGSNMILSLSTDYMYTFLVLVVAFELMIYCWLAVDINQTSINGLYRDRLASAYLVGADTAGDIDIEQDINLQDICNYDAGSTAPYHLINVALNLQSTTDIGIRDRNSDFFIFSKRFVGSDRTGYCRSENLEAVFASMDLGTAMAISAAAAAPNMGTVTSPLMAGFMTLLNLRMGYWIPHPDRLEKYLSARKYTSVEDSYLRFADQVFCTELAEIAKRRVQAYAPDAPRALAPFLKPTVAHNMLGIAFSGGGIRSATFNLGVAQELHRRGIFNHADYMSSVSGGGYLASSISTLMRHKTPPYAEFSGRISIPDPTIPRVIIQSDTLDHTADLTFAQGAELDDDIQDGMTVYAGQAFLKRLWPGGKERLVSLMDAFSWRVRPHALGREMLSKVDENGAWVNLSDGGHIENMAAIELLRRRCKIIFIGDAEADPNLHFAGLATLIRYARIDLGIDIDMSVDNLRLRRRMMHSKSHFMIGKILYPPDPENGLLQPETGYLVYLKSSLSGDEDEVIKEYKDRNPAFPHETTADQLFDEGQFEAYRALGEHVAKSALPAEAQGRETMTFEELETWVSSTSTPNAPERTARPDP